jgi:carbonic anhydrase
MILQEILEFNQRFVDEKRYESFKTSKFPDKKLVILTCMDTRLVELLPYALNLKNGDAKIIKNAGAIVSHPFGSVMRSILVAIYELGASEVAIIGHHGCGMKGLDPDNFINKMYDSGLEQLKVELLMNAGIDINKWLTGFSSIEESVTESVRTVEHHPLMPKGIYVHGLVISPETGKLDWVVNGYDRAKVKKTPLVDEY